MKRCTQCGGTYDDDINFCLSDGSALVFDLNPTSPDVEIPTVVGRSPFVSAIPPVPEVPESGVPMFAYVAFGVLFLIIVVTIGGFLFYYTRNSSSIVIDNSPAESNNSATAKKDDLAEQKERLKVEQKRLEAEKKKLEDERRSLDAKLRATPTIASQTPNSRTAYIIDPPTNIRESPNGRIICVIRTRNAPIDILGSTGVSDNNGTWYYTDACGRNGVVHSTQFRF